jgi:hypothetical protein
MRVVEGVRLTESNADVVAEVSRQKRWQNRQTVIGLCIKCIMPVVPGAKFCIKHLCLNREYDRGFKQRKIDSLGGRCVVCGITDIRMLTIDHVNGDGHRGVTKLAEILANPDRFQVLCANHHMLKTYKYGDQKPRKAECNENN